MWDYLQNTLEILAQMEKENPEIFHLLGFGLFELAFEQGKGSYYDQFSTFYRMENNLMDLPWKELSYAHLYAIGDYHKYRFKKNLHKPSEMVYEDFLKKWISQGYKGVNGNEPMLFFFLNDPKKSFREYLELLTTRLTSYPYPEFPELGVK